MFQTARMAGEEAEEARVAEEEASEGEEENPHLQWLEKYDRPMPKVNRFV